MAVSYIGHSKVFNPITGTWDVTFALAGRSTDTKPADPDKVTHNSVFIETDTGNKFVFDKETQQWAPYNG